MVYVIPYFFRVRFGVLSLVLTALIAALCDSPTLLAQSAEWHSLVRIVRLGELRSPDTAWVRALNELAYHYDGYKTDSAMALAEKARSAAESLGDKRGLARAYMNIGNIHETKGQHRAALAALFRAVEIAQALRDTSIIARAYNGIGIVYWDRGEYESAIGSYLASLRLYEKIDDKANTVRASNNIAMVFQYLHKSDDAMRYFRYAHRIAVSGNDKKSEAIALGNIGNLYRLLNRFDSALTAMHESLRIGREIDDRQTIALQLNSIGGILRLQGKYKEALEANFEALRIKETDKEDNISANMISTLESIALSLAAIGRAGEGLVFAQRAVDSAEATGAKTYQRDALEVLVTVYDSLGRHKEALAVHRRLGVVQDSLLNEESLKKSLQLQAQYESEKKDKQILVLTKDQELQVLTRRMLLALGVALVAGLGALYSRYRLKAKSEQALQTHNTEILRQQRLLEQQADEIQMVNTALHEKNLALEQLNNEKNEFLGIAAHDLKNPLSQIILATSRTTRYYNRMTGEEVMHEIHRMGVVAGRMNQIISNLLDVNAIEREGMLMHLTSVDIVPKVQAALQDYAERAAEKEIALHFESPTVALAFADEQAITQVLDNIISNALKYSPLGKNVFIRVISSIEAVRVEVQDEGQGITPEDMQKLFGKFARLSARPTGGEHSTGLGLSIVKKMVEAMNGEVWCESEVGKGATFIVELPIAANN